MDSDEVSVPPVACSLERLELDERLRTWRSLASRALAHAEPTEAGARFVFRADADVRRELGELIALERECCPWIDFAVQEDESIIVEATSEAPAGREALAETIGLPGAVWGTSRPTG
ncbi:MAG: hypothetical protein M3O70_21780 [Actinomycetota bacterium]|nr:hypothetical protein [Actinomycetota bacterium]